LEVNGRELGWLNHSLVTFHPSFFNAKNEKFFFKKVASM
jgi:hypothetical protein